MCSLSSLMKEDMTHKDENMQGPSRSVPPSPQHTEATPRWLPRPWAVFGTMVEARKLEHGYGSTRLIFPTFVVSGFEDLMFQFCGFCCCGRCSTFFAGGCVVVIAQVETAK